VNLCLTEHGWFTKTFKNNTHKQTKQKALKNRTHLWNTLSIYTFSYNNWPCKWDSFI